MKFKNKYYIPCKFNDLISHTKGEVRPTNISQTVSVGDPVTFTVEKNNIVIRTLRWRHNGREPMSDLRGKATYTIPNVTIQHAGVYECYQKIYVMI